jgi:hypothetical protein
LGGVPMDIIKDLAINLKKVNSADNNFDNKNLSLIEALEQHKAQKQQND